jgi:hypothetical protein
LLTRGTDREVNIPGLTRTRKLETYTVPEAAEALGRSESNFRRWLQNEIVPAPFLVETTNKHVCYCLEELEIIGRHLAQHETGFASLCRSHDETITRMYQAIHGFRDMEFRQVAGRTR